MISELKYTQSIRAFADCTIPYFSFEKSDDGIALNELNEINLISLSIEDINEHFHHIDHVLSSEDRNVGYEIETNLVTFIIRREITQIVNFLMPNRPIIEVTTEEFIKILKEKKAYLNESIFKV